MIVDIVHEAFEKHSQLDIEAHFGRLFRTPYFNTAGRKYVVPMFALALSASLYLCMNQTRQCRLLPAGQSAHMQRTDRRRQAPEFVDTASLSELVELKQSASHRDPITARKLNALGSKRASANYRVCTSQNE